MALGLQPIPGQRVPFTDGEGKITSAWFYFIKTQIVDAGLIAIDDRLTAVELQNQDAAILLSFERARR
jgi:hypothetical protein